MREQQRKAKEKNHARNGICPECGGRGAHWVNTGAFRFGLVPAGGFWMQAAVLAVVGIGITLLVYGAVALIVKADDAGVALARNGTSGPLGSLTRAVGRGLPGAGPALRPRRPKAARRSLCLCRPCLGL